MSRYEYYVNDKKQEVYCVTKYENETVKGIAKCSPEDKFDLEKGKRLAKARCVKKLYNKKLNHARDTLTFLMELQDEITCLLTAAENDFDSVFDRYGDAAAIVDEILENY